MKSAGGAGCRGKPHKSNDPEEHISIALYDAEDNRIASVFVYEDGTGRFCCLLTRDIVLLSFCPR